MKFLVASLVALATLAHSASAQHYTYLHRGRPVSTAPAARFDTLPRALDGSMMPFDFSACSPVLQFADTLSPVGVVYVARHGARFLSSRKKLAKIEKALFDAKADRGLSPLGLEFLDYLGKVEETDKGRWGALSPEGVREEVLLADRMARVLPALADSSVRVRAISSFVPRAVMTMYQFSHRLIDINDSISVSTDEGHQFSHVLYCFEADSAYAAFRGYGDWRPVYDEFVSTHVSTAPAARLLADTAGISQSKLRNLTLEMYGVMSGNRAAGLPAPTTEFMSLDEYEGCWLAQNLRHYLRNNISSLSSLAASATTPLLQSMMADADNMLSGVDAPALSGYFGHAETLLPLLSLMRLPGCYALPLDYDDLAASWQLQEITPLAANLTLVLLRSDSGASYACLQLNGRNISPFPVPEGSPTPDRPVIVPWTVLREWWSSLISASTNPDP